MIHEGTETPKLNSKLHKTIRKVSSDIEEMKFNTAIAAMMGFLNDVDEAGGLTKDELSLFIRILCPFAPHLAEEIWEKLGNTSLCAMAPWPSHDEAKTVDETIEIAVQVNGKMRAVIEIPTGCDKDTALAAAHADQRLAPMLADVQIIKEIYVPNKIINFVVKPR